MQTDVEEGALEVWFTSEGVGFADLGDELHGSASGHADELPLLLTRRRLVVGEKESPPEGPSVNPRSGLATE